MTLDIFFRLFVTRLHTIEDSVQDGLPAAIEFAEGTALTLVWLVDLDIFFDCV